MPLLKLPVEPESVPAARRFIGMFDLPEPPEESARLMVSELVANAVVHAGLPQEEQIELRVRRGRTLRVEVCHQGEGFEPRGRDRAIGDAGGWGLPLVDALAEDWGVEAIDGTTCVWFSCPIEPA